MKLKHVLTASLWIVLIAVASCKKDNNDDDQTQQKTTAERIQAKWSIQNIQIREHSDTVNQDTTVGVLTTDYFDIRSDNKIYASLFGETDTLGYVLTDDSTMQIESLGIVSDSGTYKIRNLTDNTLTLYTKESDPSNSSNYAELSWNLKK